MGAVHLAGGEEDEALDRPPADCVEQHLRPFDVRRHELATAFLDRLLDVRLGGRVHDHVDVADDLGNELGVADVAVDEGKALVAHEIGEVVHVARVCERVEEDDLVGRAAQKVAHEVRRDEPRAAGDENAFLPHSSSASIV
jgi:hypothetical protein